MYQLCPCESLKSYVDCCKRYHDGVLPPNALALMRSRYSAYALHIVNYIIQTTHPENLSFTLDILKWRQQISEFCESTKFEGLTILEFIDGKESASVTFTAKLTQNNQDVSFTEKSFFVKIDGKWLYKKGQLIKS